MKSDEHPWSLSIENRPHHVVENIYSGDIPDWLELLEDDIHKREPLPDIYTWEDWMWEISTWYRKLYHQKCEVDAYRLLRRLQGHVIPRFYGTIRLPISTSPLHPITGFIPGIAVKCIQGTNMDLLKPGIDLALAVSDQVMDAFRNINDEMCVLHNDVHIDNIILRTTDTPVIVDFEYAMIREPNLSDAKWTEIARQWSDISAVQSSKWEMEEEADSEADVRLHGEV